MIKRIIAMTTIIVIMLQTSLGAPVAIRAAEVNEQDTSVESETEQNSEYTETETSSYAVTQNGNADSSSTATSNPQPYVISPGYVPPNVVDTDASFIDFWSEVSKITTVVNPDGTLSICVVPDNSPTIYVYELDSSMQVEKTLAIPKAMEKFGAYTKDPATGYHYVFTGMEVADGDKTTENLNLSEYDENGDLLRTDSYVMSRFDPDYGYGGDGIRDPFNATGCTLTVSGDYLYVAFGREMHQAFNSDTNHQGSYGTVYDLNTFTRVTTDTSWRSPWMSHVLEQVVIPIDDGFALLQKGDASPRALLLSEITAGELQAKEVMYLPGESGNNYTYAEIGGLAETPTGYLIVGTHEQEANDTHTQDDHHVGSRDLFAITVSADLQEYSQPIYLTDFTNKYTENAANPKMVQCGTDEYVILYEMLAQDGTYKGTYRMVIDSAGNIISPSQQLPDVRLNMGDELVYNPVTDTVFWTINSGSDLVVYELDPTAPIVTGTAPVTVNVQTTDGQPLAGADVDWNGQPFTETSPGTYVLELPYGKQTIHVTKDGYGTVTAEFDNKGGTVVEVTLGGAQLRVNVEDGADNDLSGVTITTQDGEVLEEEGSSGFYSCSSSQPAGEFILTFEKDGYITTTTMIPFDEIWDSSVYVIHLDEATFVSLNVTDSAGNPLPTFDVYIDEDPIPVRGENGVAKLPGLEAGSHSITITAPGYYDYNGTFYVDTYLQQFDFAMTSENDAVVDVTGVTLDQSTLILERGEYATLFATISPIDATNKGLTWTSSNPSVATVNSSGKVTAVSFGTTTITCTTVDGGYTASCNVTVVPEYVPVSGIGLDQTSLTMNVDEVTKLTASVLPSYATEQGVVWSSDNYTVANVDANGNVTAVSPGTATISATTVNGQFTATCHVTVLEDSIQYQELH